MTQYVLDWDGATLPAALHDLPPGRYVMTPWMDDELTPEEEAGLIEALDELEAGGGIPWDEALRELRAKYSG